MDRDSEVLNVREAAAFLGAHVQTVRKLARGGKIPSFKVGKDWRFRREALLNWTDGQRSDGKSQSSGSVLVVDDEENICRLLTIALERFGYRVRQTTSAARGFDLIAEEAPTLILLDLMMPEMNGPQFLKLLRKTHPSLPVVIVTGYPDSDLMMQAMQYAPVMLLSKPVEADLLERTLRSVMGENAGAKSPG